MICFFTSSPCLPDSPDLNPINCFTAHLRSFLPEEISVLFVSAAPDDPVFSDWCSESMHHSFAISGFDISDWILLDSRTAKDVQNYLLHSDLLILGGGHVPTQNAFLHSIGLRDFSMDITVKTKHGGIITIEKMLDGMLEQ
jgi:dipeptidase E